MTDVNGLLNRIDQEVAAEVARQKAGWAELAQANRERTLRLQRYEAEAQHLILSAVPPSGIHPELVRASSTHGVP